MPTITGLITSHGTLSLERLHTMLKLISGSGGSSGSSNNSDIHFDMNMIQLRQYLQEMIDRNKIEIIDDMYSVIKVLS